MSRFARKPELFGRLREDGSCDVFRTYTMTSRNNDGTPRYVWYDEVVGHCPTADMAKALYGHHLYLKED